MAVFEFATASNIIFGEGAIKNVASVALKLGKKALIITGKNTDRCKPLFEVLDEVKISTHTFSIPSEPTIERVNEGVEFAREHRCDFVIGFGGGSALDGAKAIAALLTNKGEALDYLEVIGKGQPLENDPLPCIAIPTTAGTGSEVTRNAVLASTEHNQKVSLRHVKMLPDVAIIDPVLTYSMPPFITATTGLDALTQCMEPFVSNKANAITDMICRDGIQRVARSLQKACIDGSDEIARRDMALASLYGGMALANAKLGAVHGLAGAIGGMFPIAHGLICGRLLPFVMEANIRALREYDAENYLAHYRMVAQILTGDPQSEPENGIEWVKKLCVRLDILPLTQYGLSENRFDDLIVKSKNASSMKGNPVALSDEAMWNILAEAA